VRFDSVIFFASKKRELFPNEIPMWKRNLDILFILAVLPVPVPLISVRTGVGDNDQRQSLRNSRAKARREEP